MQSVQSYERIVLFRLGLLSASLGPGEFDGKYCDFYLKLLLMFWSEIHLVICFVVYFLVSH